MRNLSEGVPLVSVFSREPDLLPFVRHLFNTHNILTVADWDAAPASLLDEFGLPETLKDSFRKKIGRPVRPAQPEGGRVIYLRQERA